MGISVRKIKENLKKDLPPNIEEVEALHTSVNNIYQYTSTITENIKKSVKMKLKGMTSITELLAQKMAIFQAAIQKKNITIDSNITLDKVVVNSVSLGVVIHNLLDNAIKNNDSSTIWIENRKVPEGWQLFIKSKNTFPNDLIMLYNQFFSDQLTKGSIESLPIGLGFKTIKNMLHSMNATAEWLEMPDGIQFVITFWQEAPVIDD